MPKLYIDEAGKTLVYEILEDEATIGRGAANDVQIRDRRASKHHAVIRRIQDRWRVVDLETKNGTRVNGTYRNAWWLRPGDAVSVGEATIRFDAPAGAVAPVGVPATAARPEAVAPPAPPAKPAPVVAAPPARPASPVAAPAAPARAARAAPARSAPAPARGRAPTRGGGRDDAGPDDDRTRRAPRRSTNNSVIVLLGGLGAIAFLALMFALMAGGTEINQDVLITADRMAGENDFQGAIAYIKANGERTQNGWARLQGRIDRWEKVLENIELEKRSEVAEAYLRENIERHTHTTTFRPKDEVVLPDEEIARRLQRFVEEYRGTRPALDVISDRQGEPWKTYRRILKDHASGDADVPYLLQNVATVAQSKAAGHRYGEAILEYELLKQTQRLMLQPELYHGLAQRADEAIRDLQRQAQAAFEAEMHEADRLLALGEKGRAEGLLEAVVSTYGIPEMVRQAQAKIDAIR